MAFYSLVMFIAASAELSIAVYVISSNPRGTQHRLLSAACLLLALSAAFWAIMTSRPDTSGLWFWYNLMAVCWLIPTPLIVHFMISLSRRDRLVRNPWFLALLYIPTALFLYKAATGSFLAKGFVMTSFGWAPVVSQGSPWTFAYILYTTSSSLFGLLSIHLWGIEASFRTQRTQARIIFYGGITTIALGAVLGRMGQLAELLWSATIGFAALKFNLMSPTLVSAARDILRAMSEGIILLGRDSRIIDVNEKATRLFGRERGELAGTPIMELLPQARLPMGTTSGRLSTETAVSPFEMPFQDPSGKELQYSLSVSPVIDRFGESVGAVVMVRDVSDLKQAEERLKFMATHDPLTNLPNRFLLNDRLRMGIAQAHRSGLSLGVMLIDLDNFKSVNDTYGHEVGDKLLRAFSERLLQCLRANDSLARMGGDEFVALLAELKQPVDPEIVARRILSAVGSPYPIDGLELTVTSSIGISVYPQDADSMESLLRNADLAMYAVKNSGRNGFRSYSDSLGPGDNAEETINAQSLVRALEENQFELYYQPIRSVDSDAILFAEVLLRWRHPTRGILTAGSFIDATDQCGLFTEVGEWVLRGACRQQRAWKDAGIATVPLAVNVSALHFQADSFISHIDAIIREYRMEPGEILFELTESTALKNAEKTREIIRRLEDFDIRIILDEFGAGFASLHRLNRIPVFALKIDRSLVQHIKGDENNMAIVRAMVTLAHDLGIEVIAGGVETREQADALNMIGSRAASSARCDGVQGFFLDRPMPASRFEERIRSCGPAASEPPERGRST